MLRKKTLFRVGVPLVLETLSPQEQYGAVFEDDGEAGFFYAQDFSKDAANPIQEALLIYKASSVTDSAKASEAAIAWSYDGNHAALFINSHPHAVFDFSSRRGYSRLNFPKPSKWPCADFKWSDSALAPFSEK